MSSSTFNDLENSLRLRQDDIGFDRRVKHNGERYTLTIAWNEYLIPKGKNFVKKVLHKCISCRKFNVHPDLLVGLTGLTSRSLK